MLLSVNHFLCMQHHRPFAYPEICSVVCSSEVRRRPASGLGRPWTCTFKGENNSNVKTLSARGKMGNNTSDSLPLPQLGPRWAGQTCGLCGNYNGNQGDDFLSGSGLVEAGPQAFSQSWRINGDCENGHKHETYPCAANPKRGRVTNRIENTNKYKNIKDKQICTVLCVYSPANVS